MQEIWKDIPTFEGLYKCSNFGNILSLGNNKAKKDKILKPCGTNYLSVNLTKNKIRKSYCIHILVAMSFLDYIVNKRTTVINHIDGNKLNNYLDNLEIVSNRYNVSDGYVRTNTSSQYTGVCWVETRKKWLSNIWDSVLKRKIFLGYFICELHAAYVYNQYLKNNVF